VDGVDVDALGRYDDDTAKDDGEKRGVRVRRLESTTA
jgi:hypothetical protein